MDNWHFEIDKKSLIDEYLYFCKAQGELSIKSRRNLIIKYFQQDTFFKTEKLLLNNDEIRSKIIKNRMKYLHKDEDNLTILDILQGFKRSGTYFGYSHFNPLLFKWFINKFNSKICYDPCGGWGHRLLGSNELQLYIYNDLSYHTYENVNRIIDFFNIQNVKTFNNDAYIFEPEYDYDSMFTCPPYFNVEKYECNEFIDIDEYNLFIESLFVAFERKKSCNTFGLVIREDMLDESIKHYAKHSYILSNATAKHINSGNEHKNLEILYIFKK